MFQLNVCNVVSCRAAKLLFAPEAQTEVAHARQVAQRKAHPPTGAFGGSLPQNIFSAGGAGLDHDQCHKDSDRIDLDGLPRVGAAVWPGEAFCNTVCPPREAVL
jgi:hypothetical protein